MGRYCHFFFLLSASYRAYSWKGLNIRFWSDYWSGSGPLQVHYLCLLIFSLKKMSAISKFVSLTLDWDFILEKILRKQEVEELSSLLYVLKEIYVHLHSMIPNCRIWSQGSSDFFTFSPFYQGLPKPFIPVFFPFKQVWKSLTPQRYR